MRKSTLNTPRLWGLKTAVNCRANLSQLGTVAPSFRPSCRAHVPLYDRQAHQQKRRRKLLSVDFAVELPRRLIYPQPLQFEREGLVAHLAPLHCVDDAGSSTVFPDCPSLRLGALDNRVSNGGRRGHLRFWVLENKYFANFRSLVTELLNMLSPCSYTSSQAIF